uniref:Uncharacterized protein n=1 Tax=Ananas comosus var. bracteatus TaxID=296719 RepID=A0A6V7PU51_ANACO|nr:unnamed protein product [Ananas comosus var. bracteatus]
MPRSRRRPRERRTRRCGGTIAGRRRGRAVRGGARAARVGAGPARVVARAPLRPAPVLQGFVRACGLLPRRAGARDRYGRGRMGVGSVREVRLVSGLPRGRARSASTRSTRSATSPGSRSSAGTTASPTTDPRPASRGGRGFAVARTIVVESYVVDVPRGSTARRRAPSRTPSCAATSAPRHVCQTMAARSASNGSNASTHM